MPFARRRRKNVRAIASRAHHFRRSRPDEKKFFYKKYLFFFGEHDKSLCGCCKAKKFKRLQPDSWTGGNGGAERIERREKTVESEADAPTKPTGQRIQKMVRSGGSGGTVGLKRPAVIPSFLAENPPKLFIPVAGQMTKAGSQRVRRAGEWREGRHPKQPERAAQMRPSQMGKSRACVLRFPRTRVPKTYTS